MPSILPPGAHLSAAAPSVGCRPAHSFAFPGLNPWNFPTRLEARSAPPESAPEPRGAPAPIPRARDFARADQVVVAFSDVEMGTGGPTDDFPHSAWLADLFLAYNRGPWARKAIDLVFNGDTFDVLKTPHDGAFTHHVDAASAVARTRRVIDAHPAFFEGLRAFLGHRGASRRVWFTVGNHDFELLFPEVQELVRAAVGAHADRVLFPGFAADIGDVHIEHGSQADPLFRIEPHEPFVSWNGRRILNLPWGSVALLDVAMPLHGLLYPCDRARPDIDVLSMLPEVRSLMLDRYWKYWTRDWLGAWWSSSDPVKNISWTMFRQVASRLQSGDASIQLDPRLERAIASGPHRLVVLGHLHDASWQSRGATKVLRTGCMRDEFHVDDAGVVGHVLPKVYAEVFLEGGRSFRSHLVEVEGPAGRAAAMPASLFDVLTPVRALRAAEQDAPGLLPGPEQQNFPGAPPRQQPSLARSLQTVAVAADPRGGSSS
jgi:hypothetical protein